MPNTRIAKVFRTGGSQAVRLPAEFRFESNEVFVTRDEATGDVILSTRPANAWGSLFDFIQDTPPDESFMEDRPLNVPASETGVFDDLLPEVAKPNCCTDLIGYSSFGSTFSCGCETQDAKLSKTKRRKGEHA